MSEECRSILAADPASDFHQRHPDWVWTVRESNVVIPVAGGTEPTDYFQRHPMLVAPPQPLVDLTDYYFRHPELQSASSTKRNLTDYYFRHQDD